MVYRLLAKSPTGSAALLGAPAGRIASPHTVQGPYLRTVHNSVIDRSLQIISLAQATMPGHSIRVQTAYNYA